ncbi:Zn(2)-C6 fungal-type domain-containing protein [Fusarium keratoplasticum]|uniref:Zn(2)-C6 fungal-type domain-containing protein n=1 Tax=Fusarium keratoplasticum TaxID=1328300 RepID=A0ACC0R7V6_9HYPO|nr:Zn(2)-C6 fungal-type domain-containing protein [Fusarium keratoplasticum]KAI8675530.1 Zn(2)-C6 fungal-type domain-containing protein [Fusarium keratoplasticum]KAI8681990.1 Zn(2)-C6 fungal-type domain-containing protein [Fusarium keratoplasticum]
MEIQFSLPINTVRAATSVGTSTATGRSAHAAAARGGTHRFALETRTRHTRRSSTRARTGCSTCEKRHVKCDETKPSCLNCMKWRGYCDGYTENPPASSSSTSPTTTSAPSEQSSRPTTAATYRSTSTVNSSSTLSSSTSISSSTSFSSSSTSIATSDIKVTTGSTAVVRPRTPPILEEPTVNTVCFANSDQRAYFDEWSNLTINFLSGGLGNSRLWTITMPQLTLQEPTLRYAAMAVGALRKASNVEFEASSPNDDLMSDNKHYLNAIIYYCEALRLQSKARPSKEGLRTAMLSSLLFICFETQRGNMPAALKHVTHGFSMLNELAACSEKAPDLVSIAPAPPALVQEILDCYKPLELQSRSFMGSYRKFFFPPKPTAPASSDPLASRSSSPGGPMSASSPPSQPGSPWTSSPTQQVPTGLPSPQSQGSPWSTSDQQTPPRAAQGPPQRPPGIAPFTKYSPYFKPRITSITNIEDMPPTFGSFEEARDYWSLLQRQMVGHVPMLTVVTAQLGLTKVKDMGELETKLSSVTKNPRISKFVDESRYWLQRWSQSFDPLFQSVSNNRQNDMQPYLVAINLRVEFLILYIYTAMPRYTGIDKARELTPYYQEINTLAELLISCRPSCGFAMDSGWTWPLFVSSFGCRDDSVRDEAIRILGQYPIRNALRDSRVFRAIAIKNREVEMMNSMEGNEHEQWLRLRRREIVFEDLGTNIIFRSAQKNPATGEWELVEEASAFLVRPDGLLDWHRQPVSDSASILSGVC